MLKAPRSGLRIVHERILVAATYLLALVLAACQSSAAPAPDIPPTPPASAFVPLDILLKSGTAPAPGNVTTAGYLVAESAGAVLVDGLSFANDGTLHLLDNANQIWLGTDIEATIKAKLQASGDLLFAPVQAAGRLEGPGTYGPSHSYRYQLLGPTIDVLTAQETTIGDLLDHSAGYENRLVRLAGSLIARENSAILVEQLGPGGLPLPKARQIKLRAPLRDSALLSRLKGVSGGAIHFGQVQIEGFWRAGTLIPLSIELIT